MLERQSLSGNSHSDIASKLGGAEVFGILLLCGDTKGINVVRSSLIDCFAQRQTFSERKKELVLDSIDSNNNPRNRFGNFSAKPLISVTQLTTSATLIRFMMPTMQYAYEFMSEALAPLSDDLDGLRPYEDRVHCRNDIDLSAKPVALDPHCALSILKDYRRIKSQLSKKDVLGSPVDTLV